MRWVIALILIFAAVAVHDRAEAQSCKVLPDLPHCPKPPKPTQPPPDPCDGLWRKAVRSDTAEGYENFATRCRRDVRVDDARQKAAERRCDAQWQTAKSHQTLDGFEGFVKSCASHSEVSTARGRIEAIRTNPLDGIVGLPAAGTSIPRDGLSDTNKVIAAKCEGGDANSCSNLGVFFGEGNGAPKDELWSTALFVRSCATNDAYGCGNLGSNLNNGGGVKIDLARSTILKERGCKAGAAFSCTNMGISYQYGYGIERNPAQALVFFEKGCGQGKSGGDALGCLYAAQFFEKGIVSIIEKDAAKALQLAEAGLKLDPKEAKLIALRDRLRPLVPPSPAPTNNLATGSTLGGSTPAPRPTPSPASRPPLPSPWVSRGLSPANAELSNKCHARDTQACVKLGIAFEYGKDGAPRDAQRAISLYEQACNSRNAYGCQNGAELMMNPSSGVAVDKVRARKMVIQGLELQPANVTLLRLKAELDSEN